MSFTLKGELTNGQGQRYSNYTVKAFHKESIFFLEDELVGSAVTLDDGTFRIDFTKESFILANSDEPKIYLKVFDTSGGNIHETPVIDPNFVAFNNSNEASQCEAVVVGSGFGGTIITSSLVNKYVTDDKNIPDQDKRKVVLLERGQWWVSHELPSSPGANEFEKEMNPDKAVREYLETNDIPYRTWAYPDNIN